ncbi:MAG: hypothetical protein ACOYBE_02130 [Blautia sp.]|jgi:hypothetical protein
MRTLSECEPEAKDEVSETDTWTLKEAERREGEFSDHGIMRTLSECEPEAKDEVSETDIWTLKRVSRLNRRREKMDGAGEQAHDPYFSAEFGGIYIEKRGFR